jgi:hypothetical protein
MASRMCKLLTSKMLEMLEMRKNHNILYVILYRRAKPGGALLSSARRPLHADGRGAVIKSSRLGCGKLAGQYGFTPWRVYICRRHVH